MKSVRRLAFAFLREHPIRTLMTVLATAAATCLVLWVVSGYEGLLKSYDVFAKRALGRYTLSVDPISRAPDRFVMPEVAEALRADPAVDAVDGMWAERVMFQTGRITAGPASPEVLLLGTDAPEAPFPMLRGSWIHETGRRPLDVALSEEIAGRLGVDVNDELRIGRGENVHTLRVVGIVDNPPLPITGRYTGSLHLPSPSIAGAYVSMRDAETLHNKRARFTFLGVKLKQDADAHIFRYGWGPRLSRFERPVQFQEDYDLEEELDEAASADNIRLQSYAATGIAMLLAFLVAFNTLNMGVTERIRQFALLRAVVLTRAQVAQLVFVEAFLLATFGFVLGVLLGFCILKTAGSMTGELWRHGVGIGSLSLCFAGLASYGAAGFAALIPAYRATRVRPLDAIAPQTRTASDAKRATIPLTVPGVLFITLNPVLSFVFPPDFDGPVIPIMLLSFTSLAMGCLMITPALVVLVERVLGPLLARVLRINPRLLSQQMSCHMWRSVGSAIALSIGLSLFIAIQVWGHTMLETFVPGSWAPDAMVIFSPEGMTREQAEAIADSPGFEAKQCAPFVVEQPRLLEDLTDSAERASIVRQDNVIMVGIDPTCAFAASPPLFECEWVRGSPEEAVAAMKSGRGCVVPEHFLSETGLGLGDRFAVVPPEKPNEPVQYEVAGSIRLSGWHWQTKPTGMRVRTHRAAALVFAGYDSVATDFDLTAIHHIWLNYDPADADPASLGTAARDHYAALLGTPVNFVEPARRRSGPPDPRNDEAEHGPEKSDVPSVRVVTADEVRHTVRTMAGRWLWMMSILPLVAVLIACMGLLNVIVASIRVRRWDMGVLRAIGFTRGTLMRLVVAEGMLVGLVACLLSFVFGFTGGWCGTAAASYFSFFGGLKPVLVVPFGAIIAGWMILVLFTALVAVWPAASIGRTQPLTLLQQGRSAF